MIKKITIIISFIFSNQVLADTDANDTKKNIYPNQNLECFVTSDNKRYEDLFIVKVRAKGYSHLYYKRKHLASPTGEYGEPESVRGCYTAHQKPNKYRPKVISIICASDGEEGFIDIDSKTLKGDIYFYYPKIGYPERISLDIECKHI